MLLDPRPHWRPLCKLLDLEHLVDDPRFADNEARMKNCDALAAIIGEVIGAKDWAHWRPIFEAWDAPWELIRTIADIYDDPQVHANEMMFATKVGDDDISLIAGPALFERPSVRVV